MKPMLAGKAPSFDKIKYPVLATPKIDGIRCLIVDGKAVTRALKPIPNIYVRETIEQAIKGFIHHNLDGELILEGKKFNEISSAIMTYSGEPLFTYKVFDVREPYTYTARMGILFNMNLPLWADKVIPRFIDNAISLELYETFCLHMGYEGVMIRDPHGPYKWGRSTTKEGWLLKIKRFEDSEARVIGFEELLRNNNEAFTGELGQTKRSSHIENKSGGNRLGAFIVQDVKTGVIFNIGTGMSDEERIDFWLRRYDLLNVLIKYKYQPHGTLDKPRSPVFLGFRFAGDL